MIPLLLPSLFATTFQGLPPLFPKEIPLPKDAKVQQVLDRPKAPAGQQLITVSYRTALDTASVMELYRAFFRDKGKDLQDLGAQAPVLSAQLPGYRCTVTVLEALKTVMVSIEPEGRTFTAFHEAAVQAPPRLIQVQPLDTSRWRLAGATFPGDFLPGVLLVRREDGSLWGFGLGLVQPRTETDAHGKRYCRLEGLDTTPQRLAEGVRFATAAMGAPLGAIFTVDDQGTLRSFGADCGGRLGQGVGDATHRWFDPTPILERVRFVTAGSCNAAAITEEGALWAWGSNLSSQVLGCSEGFAKRPLKVMDDVVSVAVARDAMYAVKTDGTLWGWGEAYDNGFLDGGVLKVRKTALRIMDGVKAVFTADIGPIMALKADGSLWTWGANSAGLSGQGTKGTSAKPARIADQVVKVAMNHHHAALLKEDGSVWTWGRNWTAQCGFPMKEADILKPRKLCEGATDVAVTAGETYVLKQDGTLWGTGRNASRAALPGRGMERQVGLVEVRF